MKRFIFFTLLFYVLFFTFISYSASKAYFASMAAASGNTFTAASEFPTTSPEATPTASVTPSTTSSPNPTQSNLVINEVSPNGNSSTEWIELYNPTSSLIDVSGWKINDENASDTFPNVAPIPAGGYAVIIADDSINALPGSAVTIQLSSAIGNGLSASSEGVALRKPDDSIVDGVNWGTATTYFNPSATAPGAGQTIRRIPNGTDTNSATDWSVGAPSIGVGN